MGTGKVVRSIPYGCLCVLLCVCVFVLCDLWSKWELLARVRDRELRNAEEAVLG